MPLWRCQMSEMALLKSGHSERWKRNTFSEHLDVYSGPMQSDWLALNSHPESATMET